MTSGELIEEVKACTLGASYPDEAILKYLNRAVLRVAAAVLLPLLEASAQVQTDPGKPWVDLPSDYHREMQKITSAKGKCPVRFFRSFMEFMHHFPLAGTPEGGHVEAAAIRANRLYYYPAAAAEGDTLSLYYYRKPVPMESPQDTPDGLPHGFAEDILVNFAAMELWKLIEQDDSSQPNVEKYEKRFNGNLAELVDFVGPTDGDPVYVRDTWGRR